MRPAPLMILLVMLVPGLFHTVLADTLSVRAFPDAAAAPDSSAGPPDLAVPAGGPDKEGIRPGPDESSPEVVLFRILNGKAQNRFFDLLMPLITDFSKWRIVLIIIWAILIFAGGPKGRWAAFMMIPLIAASDQLCASVIKPLTERARPCQVLGSVHLWNGSEGWITTPELITKSYKSSFSFPSNHAANMTSAMVFLGLVYRKWILPLAFLALAVSYSRVYVGVHWTSDVIAGIVIGALLASIAWKAFRYLDFDSGDKKWHWRS
jgi:undecaprenyl-diphosphatase